jgi:hypothetical protein
LAVNGIREAAENEFANSPKERRLGTIEEYSSQHPRVSGKNNLNLPKRCLV